MDRMLLRLAIAIATLLIAALAVTIALGFLCFGVYLALLERLSGPWAALATAGIALVFAVAIVLIGRIVAARKRSHHAGRGNRAGDLGMMLGEELAAQAAAHPYQTTLTALLSGFAVGASPELRQLLRDLFLRP